MSAFGLTQLGVSVDVLAWAAIVLGVTYLVAWFVALFHPDAARRTEAKWLLRGHPLHRKPLRGTQIEDEQRDEESPGP